MRHAGIADMRNEVSRMEPGGTSMGGSKPLRDRIAVVAGATRGAGRGIACMLGEAGATVYCTGRNSRARPNTEVIFAGRPETMEETAEMVTARGGHGIPARTDHLDEAQVESLFKRVE